MRRKSTPLADPWDLAEADTQRMPKRIFKKLLPAPDTIQGDAKFRVIGCYLHDPNLWHLNRHSLTGAMAIGLFVAFLPFPFQMLLAALLAILFRVNLPLSVLLVWITNPLTIAPIFLFAFKLGVWALDLPADSIDFELNTEWIRNSFSTVWEPLLTGCLILSVSSAMVGYFGTHIIWRMSILKKWKMRRLRKQRARIAKQRALEHDTTPRD